MTAFELRIAMGAVAIGEEWPAVLHLSCIEMIAVASSGERVLTMRNIIGFMYSDGSPGCHAVPSTRFGSMVLVMLTSFSLVMMA